LKATGESAKGIFDWGRAVTWFRRDVRFRGWARPTDEHLGLAFSPPEIPPPAGGDSTLTSLREQLMSMISNGDDAPEVNDESPLISTSRLDSLALFKLVLWIEEQTGAPIDLTTVDLASEWNTIDGIIRFIEARRAGAAGGWGGS
jgi:acyl carrier protein